jgi:hypothetical protein
VLGWGSLLTVTKQKQPAGPPMTPGNMRGLGVYHLIGCCQRGENDLSMSRHETHEWKTLDAMAPALTCTRCWIDGGNPMASRPCPGVRMRLFNKSALAQIETKNARNDQLKPTKNTR